MTASRHVAAVRRAVSLGLALAVLAPACAVNGLSFLEDNRVKIRSPKTNETVTLPFTLSWEAEDVDAVFVVFFDRSPMRPNQTLRSLVPERDPCRVEPDCPDTQWLADRNIYVVDGTRLEVEHLPDRRDNNRAKDRHDVTIALLDNDRRSGESAFTREFIVERER